MLSNFSIVLIVKAVEPDDEFNVLEKPKNVLKSETRNQHTAFKITIRVYSISRRLLRVFLSRLVLA